MSEKIPNTQLLGQWLLDERSSPGVARLTGSLKSVRSIPRDSWSDRLSVEWKTGIFTVIGRGFRKNRKLR